MSVLQKRQAVLVFIVLAAGYFLSTLVRAVTGTLAPTLAKEFSLNASELGLLAGGYFLGFAATQLPMGHWLDRYGPKRVLIGFLGVSVLGSLVFAGATNFAVLLAARVLCGVGVSACLMAPLTGYRRWLTPVAQLRANSWMLMTGSLGMVAATLPVQWLLPAIGWRPLFWAVALLTVLVMLLIAIRLPAWPRPTSPVVSQGAVSCPQAGYAEVWRHPYFRRVAPVALLSYGGMVAVQTLWAGPWMQRVAGYSPLESAEGLFWVNVAMLGAFWAWGMVTPWLQKKGIGADRLMAIGQPVAMMILVINIVLGPRAGGTAWAIYCVSCTATALAQPALGMAFPPTLAGRALSAYNLVLFVGVFVMQWGIGVAVDGFISLGWSTVASFRAAMSLYLLCCLGAYLHFMHSGRAHNAGKSNEP